MIGLSSKGLWPFIVVDLAVPLGVYNEQSSEGCKDESSRTT